MVSLKALPRDPGRHPHRLVRPEPARGHPGAGQLPGDLGHGGPRHQHIRAERHPAHPPAGGQLANVVHSGRSWWHGAGGELRTWHRDDVRLGHAGDAEGGERVLHARADQRQQRPVGGGVARLHPGQEAHLLQEREQLRGRVGLHVQPGGRAILGDHRVVLDVAVRGQHQRLGALPGAQPAEVLRGQVVQPAQPLLAGHGQDPAVRPVHQADGGGEGALLGHRVPVVRGGRFVRRPGLDLADLDHDLASCAPQEAHSPNSATCPMSTRKPRSRRSVSASGPTVAVSTSSTVPQERHTRCTCCCSPTAW